MLTIVCTKTPYSNSSVSVTQNIYIDVLSDFERTKIEKMNKA